MDDLFARLQRYVEASTPEAPSTEAASPDDDLNWQAELAREHGVRLGARRVPAAESEPAPEPEDPGEDPTIAWKREMLRDLGLQRSRRPHGPPPLAGQIDPRLLPPAPQGFSPDMIPADFARYCALVSEVFEKANRALAAHLVSQPVYFAAFDAWNPGDLRANQHITQEVYARISAAMGSLYRFKPAELGFKEHIERGEWGSYSAVSKKIYLSGVLLKFPAREVFATIIHEQIHRLQDEMMQRLRRTSRFPLTHPERALAYYWLREEPKLKAIYAAMNVDEEGHARYRKIGKEHHAFWTEDAIVPILERAVRSSDWPKRH